MKEAKNTWLIVSSKENWDISDQKNVFGLNRAPGRLGSLRAGDNYVVYISKAGFIGWGEITTPYFVSDIEVWKDKRYRHRFGVSQIKSNGNILPGAAVKDELDFITDKNRWSIHFRGGLTKISPHDFEIIKTYLQKSHTAYTEIAKTNIEIGDALHDRIVKLFVNSGFSISKSNKTEEGPDVTVEDPLTKEGTRIIIQCKNTNSRKNESYPSLQKSIDEYAYKKQKYNAAAAIIVISGYKVPRQIDPVETLEKHGVAIWTDDVVQYYEDLANKISGFSKYQILGDLNINAKFDEDAEFNAIKINQSKYTYYIVAVNADWLLKTTTVLRRINYSGKISGYQRLLNKKRITKDIPAYLEKDNWIFPNAIICTSKPNTHSKFSFADGKIKLPSCYGSWWVIDGQHRLYSFAHSTRRADPRAQLILTLIDSALFGDDSEAEQANIFVSLNQQAKRVQKKLLIELQEVLGIENPAVQIVFGLSTKSVFKDSISGYSQKVGDISLVAFAEDQALKQLISRYRGLNINKEELIEHGIKDLTNFFSAVENEFKEEWTSGEYVLKTDRGIKGLLALYVRIIDKYGDSKKVLEVLSALRKSGMEFRSEYLVGKHLGAGGGKRFADDMAIYISKVIPNFEPQVQELVLKHQSSAVGDIAAINTIKLWLSELEGVIRVQQMHIDATTFKILRSLNKEKIKEIKLFFGDAVADQKEMILKELEAMRKDGYDIVVTRARKPITDGGFLHKRWIGTDNYCINTDADLKENALKNSGVDIQFVEWNRSPQLKEFDDLWEFAMRNPKGVRLDYDWNGEQ